MLDRRIQKTCAIVDRPDDGPEVVDKIRAVMFLTYASMDYFKTNLKNRKGRKRMSQIKETGEVINPLLYM